jgi:hypothetical protein
MFLLSNLAFAAGGGAAADGGAADGSFGLFRGFFFMVEYPLAFENSNREFREERLAIKSLYEKIENLFREGSYEQMDLSKLGPIVI